MTVTLEQQIACVEREVVMRQSAYPRFVASGKMKKSQADVEIARMEAVAATLRQLQAQRQPGLGL